MSKWVTTTAHDIMKWWQEGACNAVMYRVFYSHQYIDNLDQKKRQRFIKSTWELSYSRGYMTQWLRALAFL